MKVLKNTSQKNVVLNKDYYTEGQVRELLNNKEICYFDDEFQECYDYSEYVSHFRAFAFRIFLEKGDELKVVINDGIYTNVLVKANGNKYFVVL